MPLEDEKVALTDRERETLVQLEGALAETKPRLGRFAGGIARPRCRILWAAAIAIAGLVVMVGTFAVHLGLAIVGMVIAVGGLALLVEPICCWATNHVQRRGRAGT